VSAPVVSRGGFVARIGVAVIGVVGLYPGVLQARFIQQAAHFEEDFQQGTEAMRKGQLEEAAADFLKCIAAAPRFAESYFDLGLVRLQQGRADEAAKLFGKASGLKPSLRGVHLFLGIARYRLDEYSEAVAAMRREVEAEPANADALMWLGLAEMASGDAGSAVPNLEKAAKLKPDNVDILYHLGKAYMQMSKETYERMDKTDPTSWRVHQVLAESFEQADRLEDAARRPATRGGRPHVDRIAVDELEKLRKAVGKLGDDPSDEAVHNARIKGKRARYAAELARPGSGKRIERFVERAKRLQDVAGEHQDAVVAAQRFRELAEEDPAVALAAGRLVERQRIRKAKARRALPKAWKKLERAGRRAWR